jgi:hypothetical protein
VCQAVDRGGAGRGAGVQAARVPWLRTLLRLLQLDGAVEQVYQLGEEYKANVEPLMDWLLACGDHVTQARLVEALLRWVASRPSPPQEDGRALVYLSLGSAVLSIDFASLPEKESLHLGPAGDEGPHPRQGVGEPAAPGGGRAPALHGGGKPPAPGPAKREGPGRRMSVSRCSLSVVRGRQGRGPGCRRPGWWRLTLRTGRTLL